MSRVFESCLKSLPQGCANCVIADECAEKQLYNKGRADGIDDLLAELPYKALISRKYILDAAERIKEHNDGM